MITKYTKVLYRGYNIVIKATGDTIENIRYSGVYIEDNNNYFYPKCRGLYLSIKKDVLTNECLNELISDIEKLIDLELRVSAKIDKDFKDCE